MSTPAPEVRYPLAIMYYEINAGHGGSWITGVAEVHGEQTRITDHYATAKERSEAVGRIAQILAEMAFAPKPEPKPLVTL